MLFTGKCKDGEEFTCKIFKCIPMVKYCDKTPDCDDLSDEPEGCKWNSPKDCESEFCCHLTYSQSSDNFCRLLGINECVPNSWVCNGNYDCSTKKDEATCGKSHLY